MERDLECRSGSRYAREYKRRWSDRQVRIPDQYDAIKLLGQFREGGSIISRDEQQQRAHLTEPGRELFPSRATKDLFADRWLGAGRHYIDVRFSFDSVADLVERHTVEKAVGDSVGVFVFYQGAERREVSDQISDDHTSVSCFGGSDTKCDVGCGDRIARGDEYCGIAAQDWCDLSAGVFPCNRASAGDLRLQGEPS
jgi:hypothetical protein